MGGIFQHISISACLKGCIEVFLGFVNRKGQHFRYGEFAFDLFNGFQAMHPGHGQIHQNKIRVKFFNTADGLPAVNGFTNDLKLRESMSALTITTNAVICKDRKL